LKNPLIDVITTMGQPWLEGEVKKEAERFSTTIAKRWSNMDAVANDRLHRRPHVPPAFVPSNNSGATRRALDKQAELNARLKTPLAPTTANAKNLSPPQEEEEEDEYRSETDDDAQDVYEDDRVENDEEEAKEDVREEKE